MTNNAPAAKRRKVNNTNKDKIRQEASNLGLQTETVRKDGKSVKVRYDVLQKQINAVKREPARLGVSRNQFVAMLRNDPARYVLNSSQHLRPFGYSLKNGENNNTRRKALKRAINSGMWNKNKIIAHLNKIVKESAEGARRSKLYARKRMLNRNASAKACNVRAVGAGAYWKSRARRAKYNRKHGANREYAKKNLQ